MDYLVYCLLSTPYCFVQNVESMKLMQTQIETNENSGRSLSFHSQSVSQF